MAEHTTSIFRTVEDKFWSRVDKTPGHGPDGDCWVWAGKKCCSRPHHNYGRMKVGNAWYRAHRIALELELGHPIPDGGCSLHRCDNPPCVNPAHLYLGTPADNADDRTARGRTHKWNGARAGESNPRAKLTADNVKDIRKRFAAGAKQADLCIEFNVHHSSISDIVKFRRWKDVRS